MACDNCANASANAEADRKGKIAGSKYSEAYWQANCDAYWPALANAKQQSCSHERQELTAADNWHAFDGQRR